MVRQNEGENIHDTSTKEVYNIFFLDVVKMKMDLVEDILYDKHLLAQVLPKR